MNNFDILKSKNLDELADWLDKHGAYEYSIWAEWWDRNYCGKCEPVRKDGGDGRYYGNEFAWCELNGKCRYFQEFYMIPSNKQVIKMWLENEVEVDDDE